MVTIRGNLAEFRFYRPSASQVCLAGDFNGWRSDELRMVPSGDGYWLAVLRLPEGSYRFRYRADEQWFCDYAAFGAEPGPFGLNGVVRISVRAGPSAGG